MKNIIKSLLKKFTPYFYREQVLLIQQNTRELIEIAKDIRFQNQIDLLHKDIHYTDYLFENRHDGPIMIKSLFGEDVFVAKFFNNKVNGIYLEIGALDGHNASNTYYLEKCFNWSGILIEPIKENYDNIAQHRNSNNIILNCAISSTETEELQMQKNGSHSAVLENPLSSPNGSELETVKVRRLDAIFEEHNVTKIDYFSLDTEGYELNILASIDFSKIDITLIAIECARQKTPELDAFMNNVGYTFIRRVGFDCFYTKN